MYIKQAQTPVTQPIRIEHREPFLSGKGKYGYVRYNHYCTFCGNNGHSRHECEHLIALKNKPYKPAKANSGKGKLDQASLADGPE